ncbi:MAG TPA: tetratricopeptide repeat protein [Asanoa sp.]
MTAGRSPRESSHAGSDLASTWRSYLPEHVMRLLLSSEGASDPPRTQRIDAVILYADVVGFTAMAEALAGSGSYGTEQLTRVINRWFAVTADAISRSGGSVVDFAGDALVGMFGYDSASYPAVARRAVRCAQQIRAATASIAPLSSPAGTHSLTIRVGLAGGPVQVMLLGDPKIRLQHLVAGSALDRAVDALHVAQQDQVVVSSQLRDAAGLAAAQERDGWEVVGSRLLRAPEPEPSTQAAPSGPDLERLLTPFLHPAIRTRLRSGRDELVSEHRKVTTAFVRLPDLSDDDPRTVDALQRWLAAGVVVIDRYRGHLRHLMADDKGTVLVAVFGAPVSHEDDEERAIRCCLELLALPGGPYRAGVSTGPVYCGEVGSTVRREYAVVGDAVNLAARLMQAADAGQLLIDPATRERVRDIVVADRLAALTVKGKARPVQVWAVRGAREPASPPPPSSVAAARLVDRDHELRTFRAIATRVRSGRGHLVWLRGEAGIGKSRLAAQIGQITRASGFTAYGGSCRSHGTSTSYLVWRSIWRELLELDPALPIAAQREELTRRISRYDGTGQRAPVLAPVVNLPMPDTDLTAQLDPAGRDELLRSTVLACLRDRAAAGPLALLLEDCHWIDPASLALLDHICRHIADLPVLLVATSREPVSSRLATLDHLVEVPLAQLPSADTDRLATLRLRERYGQDAVIAPGLTREIADQAGGNPFYVEELVSYLHGKGGDPSDPHALAELQVPDSLQRLVMARIDQLTDDEKATIKVASVMGRRFQPPWITSVYPAAGTAHQVAHQLRRLDELDLTSQVAADPDPEYEFKHPITQEAAYQSITYDTRAALHERMGQLVEETFADRLSQYIDVLAHHYGRTARVDKQRIWFRAAGDHAKAMFANEAAIDYYGRLLPLVSEADRAELDVEIGSVYHHLGLWSKAEGHYRRAARAAEATGRRDILAASQRQLGDLFMYTNSYAESVSWLERAAGEFVKLGDRRGLSRTMDRITFALFRQGAYGEALAAARRHLALASEAGDLAGMSIALNHVGLVHLNTGHLEEALDHLRRALDTAQRAGDRNCTLHAASNLGWAYLRGGDHGQAIGSYRRALAVARDIGARHTANVIVGNMGEVYREQGDYARARACAMHSLRVAIDIGDGSSVADQVANLGAIAAAEGRSEDAGRLLGRAVELARDLDAPYFLCEWLHRLARLHLASGRPEAAERLNSEALAIADEHSERDTQVSAYLLSVRLRVALGRTDARTEIEQLRETAGAWTEPHEVAAMLDTMWQLDPGNEDARTGAAQTYLTLYERAPSVEYRNAYQRLTGVRLPHGPPLPALPVWIAADDSDVDALLQRVDRTLRRVEPA